MTTYETAADAANEDEALSRLAAEWDFEFRKLPRRYVVDFIAFRNGQHVAWLEFKRRFVNHYQYPTLRISAYKLIEGFKLYKTTKRPFVLAVQYNDELTFHRFDHIEYPVSYAGRSDRGDDSDMEPMFDVPVHELTRIP